MKTAFLNGSVVFPDSIQKLNILFEDDQIIAIDQTQFSADVIIDAKDAFITPGFFDIHVHGGNGHDFMEASLNAFKKVSDFHLSQGATSQYPTAISSPKTAIDRFIKAFESGLNSTDISARLLGVHLEGPYLSPLKNGAHPLAFLHNPLPFEYTEWIEKHDVIKRITAAPELPGALEMGDYCHKMGVNISMGHSNAYAPQIEHAIKHGYNSVTHLYNAMSSVGEYLGKKSAGIAEMALLKPELYVEVIADLQHVPKELILLAYQNKGSDKMILVSDCLSPAGMTHGEFFLGEKADGIQVDVKDAVYLHGMSKLAGSFATVNTLLKNVVSLGIDLIDAVKMLSLTPATLLNVDDILGSIKIGKKADLLVLDQQLNVKHVMCKGKIV